MPTVLREAYSAVKREHICEFYACKIQPGQEYVRQTNVYDGTVYDFVTHQECKEVAHELDMHDDCNDSGLDGESFRGELDPYVYANHYDEHTDDVYTSWQANHYKITKRVLKELKNEQLWDLQQQCLLGAIRRSFGGSWRSWDTKTMVALFK